MSLSLDIDRLRHDRGSFITTLCPSYGRTWLQCSPWLRPQQLPRGGTTRLTADDEDTRITTEYYIESSVRFNCHIFW